MGVAGFTLNWFSIYLSHKSFSVSVRNSAPLSCGVPQGSKLGPVHFSIYLLPLGRITFHCSMDDIQICYPLRLITTTNKPTSITVFKMSNPVWLQMLFSLMRAEPMLCYLDHSVWLTSFLLILAHWPPLLKHIQKYLSHVKNVAAVVLTRLGKREHITPFLPSYTDCLFATELICWCLFTRC